MCHIYYIVWPIATALYDLIELIPIATFNLYVYYDNLKENYVWGFVVVTLVLYMGKIPLFEAALAHGIKSRPKILQG